MQIDNEFVPKLFYAQCASLNECDDDIYNKRLLTW